MKNICLYVNVPRPVRLRTFGFFEIGNNHYYFDDYNDYTLIRQAADMTYLSSNKILLGLIKKYNGKFKISFSISGYLLYLFEKYATDVLDSFRELAKTGCVEFLSGTYSHSLASLVNKEEFIEQVNLYDQKILSLFGLKPKVFMNTELIYSDIIGDMISETGYNMVLIEGSDNVLGSRSPNYIYNHPSKPQLKILMNNFRLSETIIVDKNDKTLWNKSVKTDKFIQKINAAHEDEKIFNIIIDYETSGEQRYENKGIIEFLLALPSHIFSDFNFCTPSDVISDIIPAGKIDIPDPVSRTGRDNDFNICLWNELQIGAFNKLYSLKKYIKKCKNIEILKNWQWLQSCNHFFYMSSKWFETNKLSGYFCQYDSPYQAYINYMNILNDFSEWVNIYYHENCLPKNTSGKKLSRKKLLFIKYDSMMKRSFFSESL